MVYEVATTMKTWSDNDIYKRMQLLSALMGFPEANVSKFQYMSVEIKRRMNIMIWSNKFYYRGFLLIHGYSSKVSAADVVYGVTALLECSVESDGSSASKQFSVAYDALSMTKLDKLELGMKQAIRVQRAILRQGSADG
ncbi:hypothetical protein Leryth_006511 [Lithospermum erythrorhizon]|nr:hypothetical protein Leryth_006511 [Lithospermum erythrorhizon]